MSVYPFPQSPPINLEGELARLARELDHLAGIAVRGKDAHERVPASSDGPSPEQRLALARAMLAARRRISDFFLDNLFADPVRDLLLDLYVASCIGRQISVSSACLAAAVPQTTALRWIGRLKEEGIVVSDGDMTDHRRVLVRLSDHAFSQIDRYVFTIFPTLQAALQAPAPPSR